jgi:ectoine hydroxylase-related dioxygenase (phytanoyl-CoA dioxygenase family)
MERRVARYMRNDQNEHKYNNHHILWHCNSNLYNVDIAENLIRVLKTEHNAYNCIVWSLPEQQTPRWVFKMAHKWTNQVLSDYALTLLTTLCEMPDKELLAPEFIKKHLVKQGE